MTSPFRAAIIKIEGMPGRHARPRKARARRLLFAAFFIWRPAFAPVPVFKGANMTLAGFFRATQKSCHRLFRAAQIRHIFYMRQCGMARISAPIMSKPSFSPPLSWPMRAGWPRSSGARLTVLFQDALADERVAENPKDRCYHCKRALFDGILRVLRRRGWLCADFGWHKCFR